uniref:Uncharacterized protein n=1 Tax=Anguilla anguilla TaxID=7936 RepID=A0A0E9PN45_ANGAN
MCQVTVKMTTSVRPNVTPLSPPLHCLALCLKRNKAEAMLVQPSMLTHE